MNKVERAILLINIGSPNSYKVGDVRKYLRKFLIDERVIDIPGILRYPLVYGIIAPVRAPKSARKYKEIWTEGGSPLIVHSYNLKDKLQKLFGDSADVYIAMRYGNPGITKVMSEVHHNNYKELIICPVYPQNASSTTSSSIEELNRVMSKWINYPNLKIINDFWSHPKYISSLAKRVKENFPKTYDHILVSFHGIPLSQVFASYNCNTCSVHQCIDRPISENKYCYQAQCYGTMNLLMKELGLPKSNFSIGFQSRLTKDWLSPFTDQILEKLVKQGKKKVMVICPSFISDCLETIHEIQIEYAEYFKNIGGKELFLVPALNDEDYWAESLKDILESK